jgi:hypothetical protein
MGRLELTLLATIQVEEVEQCHGLIRMEMYSSLEVIHPGGRFLSAMWRLICLKNVFLFGGDGYGSTSPDDYLNDLWFLNTSSLSWMWMQGTSIVNQPGIFGGLGTVSINNTPGGRRTVAVWTDSNRNAYLFGGESFGALSVKYHNDVWQFSNVCSFGGYLNEFGECLSCSRGMYSRSFNSEQCSNCSIGKFSNSNGTSVCFDCPFGSYNDAGGLSYCTSCISGKFSSSK